MADAEPSEKEAGTYGEVGQVLERANVILESLKSYEGCQSYVQKAISQPTDENLNAAWEALRPAIQKLKDYYDYGMELEHAFPNLMNALIGEGDSKLESMPALAKQLGALLDFVIRFDHIKMNTPSIQNDFSYYRRSMTKMKAVNPDTEGPVSDEIANRMSLFYASHTPVMSVLVNSVNQIVKKKGAIGNVLSALRFVSCFVLFCPALLFSLFLFLSLFSTMAHSCRDMVSKKHFENEQSNLFCLRTMVASIILFDQLDNTGAFHKKSPINVKACIQVLSDWPDDDERVSLANMLKFTSRHLRDDSTLPGIVEMLDAASAQRNGGGGAHNNNNN